MKLYFNNYRDKSDDENEKASIITFRIDNY